MSIESQTVSEIGELRLLQEVLIPCISQKSDSIGDDCARLSLGANEILWSIDPCPTPVAHLLGVGSPEVMGWYTALINLSDIAACGGTPKGLLVSLELPNDTSVEYVRLYQQGLMSVLSKHDTPLLGGNVKSAQKFSATGTIIGVEGARRLSRSIEAEKCDAFLIGACGGFWGAVIGHHKGWGPLSASEQANLNNALLAPIAQLDAGKLLSSLPFQVACMDCSDGPGNALYQLATINFMDLIVPDMPAWEISNESLSILNYHGIPIENACYHFGDWQLACLVPHQYHDAFMKACGGLAITWMGAAKRGGGSVITSTGRKLRKESLNENFKSGYNSISNIDILIDRYLVQPVFDVATC